MDLEFSWSWLFGGLFCRLSQKNFLPLPVVSHDLPICTGPDVGVFTILKVDREGDHRVF